MSVKQSDVGYSDVVNSKLSSTKRVDPTFPMPLIQFLKEILTSTVENDLCSIAKHL